ncbi:hypothetical protein AmDm5_2340 [Acetobacter malorum]|nr:hypothetical protein AmDm5_2340 [Acetobacter malorum]
MCGEQGIEALRRQTHPWDWTSCGVLGTLNFGHLPGMEIYDP